MTKTVFTTNRFTATQHSTAEEKARFCAAFAKFVLSGFARRLFRHDFYRRLSCIFGHIANYDDTGFWEVWFSSPDRQRQFVQRIHDWVPVGDPHFCWSDVERELKAWATNEAHSIETVLTKNERKFLAATEAENARRATLADKTHQAFTVMAKSSNIGAFGHRQYVMVADDGSAFKVLRSHLYSWDTGQVVKVPLVNGEPAWCSVQGAECPERVEDCPVEACHEVQQGRQGKFLRPARRTQHTRRSSWKNRGTARTVHRGAMHRGRHGFLRAGIPHAKSEPAEVS